ncbi:hypothetical protein [Methylotenera sp.]|uniref:hypothetical protein n=1 Tax=Methylotenera sp. TaxID=2051956 RepID=UPI00272EECA8|nr:hypothetical protein [Methylotenera sp.]MDP2072296.1 hypothetical protein [Methylotenera sp.]MDP3005095.1 hypothetical protein [Methylotenera sp.]
MEIIISKKKLLLIICGLCGLAWWFRYDYITGNNEIYRFDRLTHQTSIASKIGKKWLPIIECTSKKHSVAQYESLLSGVVKSAEAAPVKFTGGYDIVGKPTYLYRDVEEDKSVVAAEKARLQNELKYKLEIAQQELKDNAEINRLCASFW